MDLLSVSVSVLVFGIDFDFDFFETGKGRAFSLYILFNLWYSAGSSEGLVQPAFFEPEDCGYKNLGLVHWIIFTTI